ncbi:MAG: HAMP domain-containing histidine kinase [Nitrospirota bacterium]|nr:HAMP domain-containing histidine kinase [Nitrospirota bacterium]
MRRPRLWPDTLAGRTALAVATGMVLTFGVTLLVFLVWRESGQAPRFSLLVKRVAVTAAALDRADPPTRPELARAAGGHGVTFRWPVSVSPESQESQEGWDPARWQARHDRWRQGQPPRQWGAGEPGGRWQPGDRLAQTLTGALLREGLADAWVWTRPGGPERVDTLRPALRPHAPPLRRGGGSPAREVLIRLGDGSWLGVGIERGQGDETAIWPYLVALAVFAAASTVLALWVARRVTAPLGRLAAAADRLDSGGGGPLLEETGPAEVRHAAAAFNHMQARIGRFTHDRSLMLAAISHDLRTVLTRLRLRAEFIHDAHQQARAVADLDEMQAMLGATLAFARDDAVSDATPPDLVDLASLLQDICDNLADTGAAVTCAGPHRVALRGRPVALRRAFTNLIGNAVKYGGQASVELSAREPQPGGGDGGWIAVRIADRGPGIPAELHEKVFAPFFRVETSRNRDTGGAGLGLAVARDIVRAHGGDIALAERQGGGLVVTVTLGRGGLPQDFPQPFPQPSPQTPKVKKM